MTATPAVRTRGLVKEFEKGRRTIWQRLRREPDRRERVRDLQRHGRTVLTTAALLPVGLWTFRVADRWVRVHGTIAQH